MKDEKEPKEENLTKYCFRDLFDIDEVQRIQDAFSNATGVASIITETDGTPITAPSGFSCLCNDIIRKTEKGLKNCMISDAIIGSPNPSGPRLQKCLSGGLLDGGASIMVGDTHIANWLIGQVLDDDADYEKMMRYAEEIGADLTLYDNALKKVTRMPRAQFENISRYLFINAQMLSNLAIKNAMQADEIKRRIEAETRLATEKELFRVTIQSIGDAVITTDIEGRVTGLNTAAEEITGWKNEEAKGRKLDKVFHIINEKNRRKIQDPVSKVLRTGKIVLLANHTILIAKDGSEKYIADSGAPILDDSGTVEGVVLVFRDITEEKKQQDKILYLSYYDKLTDLYNRAYFEKQLRRANQSHKFPIAVIMGDLNGLKLTNDLFGHEEGDKLLICIARVLKKACRKDDIIARWGGDEFAIILPDTDQNNALEICSRIRSLCEEETGCAIKPSIALGTAIKQDSSTDLKEVIKKAENRMYRNKLLEGNSTRSGTVSSLKRTLFEKSYETEEHALRLVELSQKVGEAMGIPENDLDDLELVAILHDVGKVAISDTILNKKGKLTDEEWIEMRKHSEIGYRIVQSSFELSHIAEYILCHHEHWDGNGYPQGRKTTSIPLLSRIVSVVDSYDAMTNERPYKKPISSKEAIEELRSCSGGQFDPEVVEVFVGLIDEDKDEDEDGTEESYSN